MPCIPCNLPLSIALSVSGQLNFCAIYLCPIFSNLKFHRSFSSWIRLQICDDLVILSIDRIFAADRLIPVQFDFPCIGSIRQLKYMASVDTEYRCLTIGLRHLLALFIIKAKFCRLDAIR